MKNLRIMIDTAGKYTTVQLKHGEKAAVACTQWKREPRFPFGAIIKALFKLLTQN